MRKNTFEKDFIKWTKKNPKLVDKAIKEVIKDEKQLRRINFAKCWEKSY